MSRTSTALITGASGGIGLELAAQFAAAGNNCILVSRSRERLEPVAHSLSKKYGVRTEVIVVDLGTPGGVASLTSEINQRGLTVDILVNNAGFGYAGPFGKSKLDEQLDMVRVNVLALTELTHRLLPAMIERGSGRILNVASTAAYQPGPFMAVYYATKAYILSFSEAISAELAGSGVTVTSLCPGPTLTGFQERAGMEGMNLVRSLFVMDSSAVARCGFRGCMKGKRVVIPGLMNRFVPFAERFLPASMILSTVALLHRRRHSV
jgi:uncharacterized protein